MLCIMTSQSTNSATTPQSFSAEPDHRSVTSVPDLSKVPSLLLFPKPDSWDQHLAPALAASGMCPLGTGVRLSKPTGRVTVAYWIMRSSARRGTVDQRARSTSITRCFQRGFLVVPIAFPHQSPCLQTTYNSRRYPGPPTGVNNS